MAFKKRPPCDCEAEVHVGVGFYHHPWCAIKKHQAEQDKQLKEMLDDMATLDDLFGGGSSKPRFYELKQPGDAVIGVITEEPDAKVHVIDFVTKKKKYFVETGVGKSGWQVLKEGEFDPEKLNHRPQYKIVVTLRDKDGKDWRIDFNTKQERDALKQAMQETGLALAPGVTIGKRVVARDGNNKTVTVKLAA